MDATALNWRNDLAQASSFDDIFNVFVSLNLVSGYRFQRHQHAVNEGRKWRRALEVLNDPGAGIEEKARASQVVRYFPDNVQAKAAGFVSSDDPTLREVYKAIADNLVQPAEVADHYKNTAQGLAESLKITATASAIKSIEDEIDAARQANKEASDRIKVEFDPKIEVAKEESGYNSLDTELKALWSSDAQARAELVSRRPNQNTQPDAFRSWMAECQARNDATTSKQRNLVARVNAAYDGGVKPLIDEANSRHGALRANTNEFIDAKRKEQNALAAQAFGERLVGSLLEKSTVSQSDAEAWLEQNVILDKAALNKASRAGYPSADLKRDMAEFYRLTNGRLSRVSLTTFRQRRSAASHGIGVLYVGSGFDKQTLFHELAHCLEDNQLTLRVANNFVESRRNGSETRSLRSLTGNPNYKADEYAYVDTWFHPYVGKVYGSATEVFSMGLQMFSSSEKAAALYQADPEHFNLMLGFMATAPAVDTEKQRMQQQEIQEKKQQMQTSEQFFKDLDRKIARAGEFWKGSGWDIETWNNYSYRKRRKVSAWFVYRNEGNSQRGLSFKSEKQAKRALFLFLAKGAPSEGSFTLSNLNYYFERKSVPLELAGQPVPDLPQQQGATA